MTVEFAPIFELGLSEKLQLLEDLWDNIATQPANIPVLDWQKEELTKRKLSYSQDPSLASSWDSVKARIRSNQRNG
jgi:putative addiction module component (TIGR02574 family)